jgi:D-alanyl-D-alanine carboxypeptidase (penicillin-binding protein 5/6)
MTLFLLLSLICCNTALAQTLAPAETIAREAYLVEAATGTVLFDKNGNERMPTSSMSKVMTMYLVLDAIRSGKLSMSQTLPVSEYAWKQQGSRMFLNVGEQAKVEDLIRGVVIQSGNDASVVLAEALGGSEANFSTMMNDKAQKLGMTNSHFMNATGLPDPNHYSTAHDLAVLAQALMRDFPEHYHFYSEQEFTYNNIKQGNRNPLLYRNIGVDGMKTGHTDDAGYGLIASSIRNGRRLVLVINGLPDMQARADESAKLLDWGYREYGLFTLAAANASLAEVPTWLGQTAKVSVGAARDVQLSLPRAVKDQAKVTLRYQQPISAPISKGQEIGKVIVTAPNTNPVEVPLIALANVERMGFWARITTKLRRLIGKS